MDTADKSGAARSWAATTGAAWLCGVSAAVTSSMFARV
jgi:hypothetical protein